MRRRFDRPLAVVLGLLMAPVFAPGWAAAADAPAVDHAAVNRALVEKHAVPRYDALVAATGALDEAAEGFCEAPDAAGLAALKQDFAATMGAWQDVQHLRFGPAEFLMRAYRFEYWPDARNSVGHELDDLLKARDPAALEPHTFARTSVAVQGLPSLERLLYDDGQAFLAADADAAYRCAVLEAITGNLGAMAGELREAWMGAAAERILLAGQPGSAYQSAAEGSVPFLKSLLGALQTVADQKLAGPLGASLDTARPRAAESWRSGLSMDNIRRNLLAAKALYFGDAGGPGFADLLRAQPDQEKTADLFERAFAQTLATAQSVDLPLAAAVEDAAERKKLEKLLREVSAVRLLLTQRLSPAIGVPVGFNAADGD